MTEIRIRDGVIANLPSTWNVLAWDATRNSDNAILQNSVPEYYSIWSEWNLTQSYNMISTWGQYDADASLSTTYSANRTLESGGVTLYPSFWASVWTYNGNDIVAVKNNELFGMVAQMDIWPTNTGDVRQFLISVGARGNDKQPTWAAAGLAYWYDSSNDHHYFECRVGEIVKQVKVNGFNSKTPHLYVIRNRDIGNEFVFYMDSLELATISHPNYPTTLWTANNQTTVYNGWWYQSEYNYKYLIGNPVDETVAYTLFYIHTEDTAYDHTELVSLCRNRYGIGNSQHTASSSTITLTNFGVFGTSTFSTIFL